MSFLRNLFRRGANEREYTTGAASIFGGVVDLGTATPTTVSEPMAIAAVCRCVNLISGSIASMPLRAKQRTTDGVYIDDDTDTAGLLLSVQPNSRTSAFEFWRTAVKRMLIDGGVFIVPRYGADSAVCAFEQVQVSKVTYDRTHEIYTISDPDQGFNGDRISESRIIFLRGMTTDGFKAVAIAAYAKDAMRLARAGDNESLNRMENSGLPQFMVTEETGLLGTGSKVEGTRKEFMQNTERSIRRQDRSIFFPRGLKAQPVASTSVDMQLQSMREFSVRDICRFFGVPPTFVFSDSSSNYKSAEMAGVDFLVNTLDPILRNIEAELLRKLIPMAQWRRRRFEFDRTTRIAADSDTRAKYLTQLMGMGVTPNEIRAMLNLGPIDHGDTAMVSANLRTISDTINQPDNANNAN